MSRRLSELHGLDAYTENGTYLGNVQDIIIDLEKGRVSRLCFSSFKGRLPREEGKKILQEHSVAYEDVTSVADIVLCKKQAAQAKREPREA